MQNISSDTKEADELVAIDEVAAIATNVVKGFEIRKAIPSREKDDMVQEVIRKYLEKKTRINKAYKGDANPKTYLTAIFYRMCCEIIRSGHKSWDHIKKEDPGKYMVDLLSSSGSDNQFIIRNEAEYLKKILSLFDDEKTKIILFLKFFFGLEIHSSDLKAYSRNYKKAGLDRLLHTIPKTNQQTFEILVKVVNKHENSDVKQDAVRIWLYKRIDQIIERLNGSMNRANYDRKTFQLLFEYIYAGEDG
ncbi:MAG: hypothetical protein K9J27_09930 [Bacteroidales bacterium]|nr:hypothetical protein [Bacteroidales bacterium]MCF8334038.1 hypothetical protein [Bacteroidales bacterium]